MDDPWFTYFRGRGKMQITPRNGKGWAALIVFVLLLTAPALLLPWLVEISPWLLVPYLVLITAIVILFIRWAISRSERIDLDEMSRDYADYKKWKRRGGGRN